MRWSPICRCWARWCASATSRPNACANEDAMSNAEIVARALSHPLDRVGRRSSSAASPSGPCGRPIARASSSDAHIPLNDEAVRGRACRPRSKRTPSPAANTTGHEWDGVKELNTPLPTWWVYTFYATASCSPSSTACSTRRGPGSAATRAACSATPTAVELSRDARRAEPRRAAKFVDRIRATAARRHPQGSRAVQLRRGRRPLGLPDELRAVPWRRRRRQHRLPHPGRRRLAVGRHARRRSTPTIQHGVRNADEKSRPVADAALRRRRASDRHRRSAP